MNQTFSETAKACLANGKRLLSEAGLISGPFEEFLYDDEDQAWSPTSFALAVLAEEEFAKGFVLFLAGDGILPWNREVRRAVRDHSYKHLISALMEYAFPDFDEVMASSERFQRRHRAFMKLYSDMHLLYGRLTKLREKILDAGRYVRERNAIIERLNSLWAEVRQLEREQEKEDRFSPLVADAIKILRYTKEYVRDEKVDHSARAIAEGSRDRQKQRALYVGVGKNGRVCSRPEEVQKESIGSAFARSKKLGASLENLLESGGVGDRFTRLIENLKVMFAGEDELRAPYPALFATES